MSGLDKFKLWLKDNNLTGVDLAEAAGVSKQGVYAMLRGERGVSRKMANAIFQFTGGKITVEELLNVTATSPAADLTPKPAPLPEVQPDDPQPPGKVRRLCVDLDADLASQLEGLVQWLPGRHTLRGEVEAALEAHLGTYHRLELQLLDPSTRELRIKRAGERFPGPVQPPKPNRRAAS